ncbi:MAG: carboxypeptidase regulatory-like domain-containing protein [Lachnospiraceae bacterium]|nr:carboxypeptidase regulatory-like domain-containing protein [Lachnospiraceae bacterium]
MKCEKCGTNHNDEVKFCSKCGSELQNSADEQPTTESESKPETAVKEESETKPETAVKEESKSSSESKSKESPKANSKAKKDVVVEKKQISGWFWVVGVIVIVVILALGTLFISSEGANRVEMYRHLLHGDRFLEELDYEQAIMAYEEAISIAPRKPEPYIALAEVYIEMGEYDEAIRVLQEGIKETHSSRLENYYAELMDELRGFVGVVYSSDADFDDGNNRPIEGVQVVITGTDNKAVYTDLNGEYVIDHLTTGTYTLTFTADGYISYMTEITLGDERCNIDAVLEPDTYSTMQGSITIADEDTNYGNNVPLSGAQIHLKKLTGTSPYEGSTTTDANGEYVFENLMVGMYELTVEKEGYQTTRQNVAVYAGQEICYNTMLEIFPVGWEGQGTASGIVYDAVTGYGVEGLTLNIRSGINQLDGEIVNSVTTNFDGTYVTPELQSGNYTIEILDEREYAAEKYLSNVINIKVLGNMDIPNQDGVVSTTMLSGQVRIVLNWGENPQDLDSHLWCSLDSGDMGHVYYSNSYFYIDEMRIADLDLDDTDSYGPETTTIYTPDAGIYTFGVHNFSGDYEEGLMNSGATVSVYLENSAAPAYVFNVPAESGYYWEVFSYDSTSQTLTPINRVDFYYDSAGYDEGYNEPYYEEDYYNDGFDNSTYYEEEYYEEEYYEDEYYEEY